AEPPVDLADELTAGHLRERPRAPRGGRGRLVDPRPAQTLHHLEHLDLGAAGQHVRGDLDELAVGQQGSDVDRRPTGLRGSRPPAGACPAPPAFRPIVFGPHGSRLHLAGLSRGMATVRWASGVGRSGWFGLFAESPCARATGDAPRAGAFWGGITALRRMAPACRCSTIRRSSPGPTLRGCSRPRSASPGRSATAGGWWAPPDFPACGGGPGTPPPVGWPGR